MNGQQLIDLPLVPSGDTCAITGPWAENLANAAVANPVSNIDMSGLHKVTGLPAASHPSDAVRFSQLDSYLPVGVSLTQIQNSNQAPLDMFGQKITGLAAGTEASDAVRFDQLPTVNPGDEIVNASGNSYVKVNTDESISVTANTNEVISV